MRQPIRVANRFDFVSTQSNRIAFKQIDLSVCAIAVRIATRANSFHAITSICLLSAKLGRIFIVKQPVMS